MRVKLQLVMCHDQGEEETVTDVITLSKHHQRIEHLGLTLAESKHLLSTLQQHLLQQQVNTFLDTCADCPDCGTPLPLKARASRSFRTLFGTFQFDSPRLEHCDCTRRKTASFRPLSALLTESVAPELLSMEAKWSSLVSYVYRVIVDIRQHFTDTLRSHTICDHNRYVRSYTTIMDLPTISYERDERVNCPRIADATVTLHNKI